MAAHPIPLYNRERIKKKPAPPGYSSLSARNPPLQLGGGQDESHHIKFCSTISNSLISTMLKVGVALFALNRLPPLYPTCPCPIPTHFSLLHFTQNTPIQKSVPYFLPSPAAGIFLFSQTSLCIVFFPHSCSPGWICAKRQ